MYVNVCGYVMYVLFSLYTDDIHHANNTFSVWYCMYVLYVLFSLNWTPTIFTMPIIRTCLYVCMYVCMYICMYMYVCCMYMFKFMYVCMCESSWLSCCMRIGVAHFCQRLHQRGALAPADQRNYCHRVLQREVGRPETHRRWNHSRRVDSRRLCAQVHLHRHQCELRCSGQVNYILSYTHIQYIHTKKIYSIYSIYVHIYWKNVCMYYVCMYVCIYALCIHMYVCMNENVNVCKYVCLLMYLCSLCMYMYVCMYVCVWNQSDLKGSLPQSIVRFVSSSQPLILANLRNYLKNDKTAKGRRIAATVSVKGMYVGMCVCMYLVHVCMYVCMCTYWLEIYS